LENEKLPPRVWEGWLGGRLNKFSMGGKEGSSRGGKIQSFYPEVRFNQHPRLHCSGAPTNNRKEGWPQDKDNINLLSSSTKANSYARIPMGGPSFNYPQIGL